MGRPISIYEKICNDNGFQLKEVEFSNVWFSYLISGLIRKGLNPHSRKEGEPLNSLSINLQNFLLPFTQKLDSVFKVRKDVAKLTFEKTTY